MKALLVQLTVPSFALTWRETRNLPLAAGYLKGSCRSAAFGEDVDIAILERENADLEGDASLLRTIVSKSPDLVGFTCYSWNLARTLGLAGALKGEMPSCTIVAGGPEVCFSSGDVFGNADVDIGVVGEGEGAFPEILSSLAGGGPSLEAVRGIFFRRGGERVVTPSREPLPDLGQIPSPYQLGYIDPSEYGSMAIETMRGCPYRCRYCGYPKRFTRLRKFPLDRVKSDVAMAREMGVRQVNILDPSFDADGRLREVCEVLLRLNGDGALSFFADLRAEAVGEEGADLLSRAGFSCVEVGLQSANPAVLERVGRRADLDAFLRGVGLLRDRGVEVRVNVITGLPGDTLHGMRTTLSFLEENGLSSCAVPSVLQVLPNTDLREEAASLGIEFQDEPPYYVLGTREMGYGDIRKALLLCEEKLPLSSKLATQYYDVPSLATYSAASSRGGRAAVPWEGSRLGDHPVTKIVLDLREGDSPSHSFLRAASEALSSSPVVWFRVTDAGGERERMGDALSILAGPNPHAAWNVIAETGREFDLETIHRLRAAVGRVDTFLDRYFCYRSAIPVRSKQIPQLFVILQPSPAGYRPAWLKDLSDSCAIFWSVMLGGSGDWDVLERCAAPGVPGGLLVDFRPGTDRSAVLGAMEKLRTGPAGERPVQFRNRLLQHVWLYGGDSVARSGLVEEYILFWGGGSTARALHLTEEAFLLDQAEWLFT